MTKRFHIMLFAKVVLFALALWLSGLQLIPSFYTDWTLIIVTMTLTYDGIVLARALKS